MLINNAWRKRTDKSVNAAKCNLFARVYYEIRLKTMQIHSFGKYFFVRQELFFLVKYTKVNTVCFERNNWFGRRNVRSVNKSQPFEWKMICCNWRGNAKNGGLEKKPLGMAKYFYYFSPVASLNVRFPSVQKMRKKDTEIFLPVSKPDGWKDFR